jgi:hypothetical protein
MVRIFTVLEKFIKNLKGIQVFGKLQISLPQKVVGKIEENIRNFPKKLILSKFDHPR